MKVFADGLPDSEAARLSAIMAEAFTERDRGWTAPELEALAAGPGVTVWSCEEGFIMLRLTSGEAEILTLAVRPDAQSRGVGRRLLAAALARSGDARVILEVGELNEAALRLYRAAGFAPLGRRRAYLRLPDGGREDALILERLP